MLGVPISARKHTVTLAGECRSADGKFDAAGLPRLFVLRKPLKRLTGVVAIADPVSSDTRDACILFAVDDHHGGRPLRMTNSVTGVVLKACESWGCVCVLPSDASF